MNWNDNVFDHWQDPMIDSYYNRLLYIGAARQPKSCESCYSFVSDMDTVALVYPKVEDIATLNRDKLSTCLVRENGEHIKVYDYRFWINLLYKQNMKIYRAFSEERY